MNAVHMGVCGVHAVSDSGWLAGDLTVSDNNSNSKRLALQATK